MLTVLTVFSALVLTLIILVPARHAKAAGTLGATLIVSSRSPWRFCRGLLSRQPSALTR
jgi:hypothetical protein